MDHFFFVTDLHGLHDRYQKLFKKIEDEKPDAVFLGGDLLPSGMFAFAKNEPISNNFIGDILVAGFATLQKKLGQNYPQVFLILGNDDGRDKEQEIIDAGNNGIWEYAHNKKLSFKNYSIYGYSYVPPTPFYLKDWERYDVSRYVDPGCISPEEGRRTFRVENKDIKYATIQQDLEDLAGNDDLSNALFLFHTPPYKTKLDRTALDGKKIDHAPLDVHVGSIAVRRFIEKKQPLITLHGHIHESTRITGSWHDKLGNTHVFGAAHDGPELVLVHVYPENPNESWRELV